jgi:hypothetical protein
MGFADSHARSSAVASAGSKYTHTQRRNSRAAPRTLYRLVGV